MVEITRCRGCKQEFYTRDQSLSASRLAHPEDAPEGPWDKLRVTAQRVVDSIEPIKTNELEFTIAMVGLRDTLNRDVRDKGDKNG